MQRVHLTFGPFVLDPEKGTLLRQEIPISIGHRGITLLATLAARPGEILTKAELMEAAWPGLAVEESNLTVQIATLRKALGPTDQGGAWIATVPRVGYRFTAPVERVEGSVRRSIAPSGKPTIAVLPFANFSGDQDQHYLSDGITEDIITELARYRSLVVIARNSSFQFRGPAPEAAEVHRQLGARYLVEGSVRRLGSRIRITAQLIDGASGFHLWAQRYDRALEDIFSVQEEVAALVASTVQGAAEADATSRSRRTPPADWAAYDYYLQGRAHYHQYEMDKGESMFTRSAELDPAFAQGHAYLAQCLVARFWYDRDPHTLQSALRSARTALLLDRNDGICNQSMGLVLVHMRRHEDAGLHFQQARTLNPHDVNIAGEYASWLNYGGQPQQSLAVLERAILLDPLPPVWFWEVKGSALFLLGRYDDAIDAYRKAGDQFFIHAFLAAAYAHLGEMEKAHVAVEATLRLQPDLSLGYLAHLPFADPSSFEHFLSGFRKAGFL